MSPYLFVMAEGTFDGVDIERTHLAGQPVDVTMTPVSYTHLTLPTTPYV